MNERLKELIKQCWVQVPYYPAGNNGHPEYSTQFSQEKFAELLVKDVFVMLKESMLDKSETHLYDVIDDRLMDAACDIVDAYGIEGRVY